MDDSNLKHAPKAYLIPVSMTMPSGNPLNLWMIVGICEACHVEAPGVFLKPHSLSSKSDLSKHAREFSVPPMVFTDEEEARKCFQKLSEGIEATQRARDENADSFKDLTQTMRLAAILSMLNDNESTISQMQEQIRSRHSGRNTFTLDLKDLLGL